MSKTVTTREIRAALFELVADGRVVAILDERNRVRYFAAEDAPASGRRLSADDAELLADAERDKREQYELRIAEAALRLVAKIEAAEGRGAPVHAADSPDCSWTLADGGYPAEYAALARLLAAYRDAFAERGTQEP